MKTNTQRPESPVELDTVDVHEIWQTIQGEGPHAGRPAYFIRLAGCNIRCAWCDTDYTSHRKQMTSDEVRTAMATATILLGARACSLVVITGGEPLRQSRGLSRLVVDLIDKGFEVQIETNGTIDADWVEAQVARGLQVVCSPKTARIKLRCVTAWKYVVNEHVDPDDGLPNEALRPKTSHDALARPHNDAPVYLQPLDTGDPVANQAIFKRVAQLALQYGYRFCPQVHKMAELP